MVTITLSDAGKKFRSQWIFRHLNLEIAPGDKVAITGFNGSGKSTLLQTISGFQSLSEGQLNHTNNQSVITTDQWYHHLAYAAPYLDLPEEYTFEELINFQQTFKPFAAGTNTESIIRLSGLKGIEQKPIKNFSSGMKQRVKLVLAIMSDTPLLLLDEPLSNLDQNGVDWYRSLIENHAGNKIILVCSNNIREEIFFCNRVLNIHDYKYDQEV